MKQEKKEFSVILLAAGKGTRFKAQKPKQFIKLKRKRLIEWSLIRIEKLLPFKEIIIGCEKEYQQQITKICKKINPKFIPILKFSPAGKTRQKTVCNALSICKEETILLHETARPCASLSLFKSVLNEKDQNVTSAEEIPFTVLKKKKKETEQYISGLLNREQIFNVQLPQKFNKKDLLTAHIKAEKEGLNFTDDSSLLFHYGSQIKVIKGEAENIKITHPQDLKIASEILKKRKQKMNSYL